MRGASSVRHLRDEKKLSCIVSGSVHYFAYIPSVRVALFNGYVSQETETPLRIST
jgi:hypothetical protein